jgi:hypothetical protein
MRNAYRNLAEKPQGRKIHGKLKFIEENGIIFKT